MTEKNKSVKKFPNLRFPGFEGEWEVNSIGNILKIGSGRDYKHLQKGNVPVYGTGGFMTSVNEYLYDGETVFIGRKGTINKPFYLKGKFWTVDTLFYTYSYKKALPRFVFNLFENINWLKYNEASGVPSLSKSTIENIIISLPNECEQQKITSFLSLVNERILSQKKIIEDLAILRSSTVQNIFNQVLKFKDSKGNAYPKWEIKKLGDVCEIKRGASPRPISDHKWFDVNSQIGWVRISDVTKSNKYLEKTEQYLSNAGISKSRLVKKGNMIMSICATIGKPIYTNFDVCIHDGFVVFENLTLDKEFLYYYLDFIQLNWYKYGQPGIQINLNSEIVNNESVVVPIIEEQIKIAQFLSKLDEKVNLENELLTQYQNQKKYLLQTLFV